MQKSPASFPCVATGSWLDIIIATWERKKCSRRNLTLAQCVAVMESLRSPCCSASVHSFSVQCMTVVSIQGRMQAGFLDVRWRRKRHSWPQMGLWWHRTSLSRLFKCGLCRHLLASCGLRQNHILKSVCMEVIWIHLGIQTGYIPNNTVIR